MLEMAIHCLYSHYAVEISDCRIKLVTIPASACAACLRVFMPVWSAVVELSCKYIQKMHNRYTHLPCKGFTVTMWCVMCVTNILY